MIRSLASIVGEDAVAAGPDAKKAYDTDAYPIERHPPDVVVLPQTTQQVAEVVRWCVAYEVPFTPRGAGTGLSGGAMAAKGGVIVSTKRMTEILEVDIENRMVRAQAGVPNLKLTRAVEAFGLQFAPDPSSQSVSTLGGNIAENAGGPHTLKGGVTHQHVLSLTLVDPVGDIVEIGSRVPGAPGPSFMGLVVGGEGTLGIVTEAWVRVVPTPAAVSTALAAFPTIRGATEAVSGIIAAGLVPSALELMDRGILEALRAAFGLAYPNQAEALLLVECDCTVESSPSPAREVEREMEAVEEVCRSLGCIEFRIARDETERQHFWKARKKGIGAMGRVAPTIVTHDGVIPRSKLPEMLDFVAEVGRTHRVFVANLFHAGDGNLHPCIAFDDRIPEQVAAAVAAGEEIVAKCVELGGSVTGEHGVGIEKIDLLKLMFAPEDLRLQAMSKSIFNSGSLCNPCKVLPDQRGCVEHMRRVGGVAW